MSVEPSQKRRHHVLATSSESASPRLEGPSDVTVGGNEGADWEEPDFDKTEDDAGNADAGAGAEPEPAVEAEPDEPIAKTKIREQLRTKKRCHSRKEKRNRP